MKLGEMLLMMLALFAGLLVWAIISLLVLFAFTLAWEAV